MILNALMGVWCAYANVSSSQLYKEWEFISFLGDLYLFSFAFIYTFFEWQNYECMSLC